MGHLLYLMFRCDGDVMENLDFGGFLVHLNTPGVCSRLFGASCRQHETVDRVAMICNHEHACYVMDQVVRYACG